MLPFRQPAAGCRNDRAAALTSSCCLRSERPFRSTVARRWLPPPGRLLLHPVDPAASPPRWERWSSSDPCVCGDSACALARVGKAAAGVCFFASAGNRSRRAGRQGCFRLTGDQSRVVATVVWRGARPNQSSCATGCAALPGLFPLQMVCGGLDRVACRLGHAFWRPARLASGRP